jgi:hypothetical protein
MDIQILILFKFVRIVSINAELVKVEDNNNASTAYYQTF